MSNHNISARQNILQYASELIAALYLKKDGTHYSEQHDLSNLYVLLPHTHVSQQFTKALGNLLSDDIPAFIPPRAGTLKNWVSEFSDTPDSSKQLINEFSRQLLFIEALQQHPDLFKPENQWQVSNALLKLFDELSLNQQNIFSSEADFRDTLQQAYGIDSAPQHLLNESKLVYTLWQAWQQQLKENALIDDSGQYLYRLNKLNQTIKTGQTQHNGQFICIGFSHYTKVEQDFIQQLMDKEQCITIDFSADDIDNSINNSNIETGNSANKLFADFISQTYATTGAAIYQRARQFFAENKVADNDLSTRLPLSCYLASNEEQQIRAIDIYVRLSILNGSKNIAVICEDRKLSRRLRALLERGGIALQDKAGWSLATTQASTIIERWLECIESDFNVYPLLDCLKSPFVKIYNTDDNTNDRECSNADTSQADTYKKNIYRFEHDIILHENVSSNIAEYKKNLTLRLQRLSHWPTDSYDALHKILDYIETSASALIQLYHSENNKSKSTPQTDGFRASDFLTALTHSLQQLGVLQAYEEDAAGHILLKTFAALEQSLQHADPLLSWHDCRVWLGMALESQTFTPPSEQSNVQLITLEQAAYLSFDNIIIASCDASHFPGSAKNSPFFNQAVRASLQLETWEKCYQQRFTLFKRTLLAAPALLITACNEDKGEEKPVSPWLELLINFYHLAFNQYPYNIELQNRVNAANASTDVFNCDENTLPDESSQAAPFIPANLVPEKVSASAYQRIINCPYQYFSADALQLRALEELSDELKKSDYGERVHSILQTFHSGHAIHGKAFSHSISEANKQEAENYLQKISESVFQDDLENNVLHKSWLHRWSKHIPAYIHWQMQHQSDWNIYQTEQHLEAVLCDDETTDNTLLIYGRLDRIDINKHQSHCIIDYKTGRTAKQADVDNGENVQLSIYSLLDSHADEVSYLSVDSSYQKVESKSSLTGEQLISNRQQNKKRLLDIFSQMKNAAPLISWGDANVCAYCNFSGLCRRAEWQE